MQREDMKLSDHKSVLLLDTSILSFLCHKKYEKDKSILIQNLVRDHLGQEIRTDSTYISGFVILEIIGITIKELVKSNSDLFQEIPNLGIPVANTLKSECDRTIEILSNHRSLSLQSIQEKYCDHLKFQSISGKHWYESFIGHHLKNFSKKRANLIRDLAFEIVIGRKFAGFDPKELSIQFAVMYITGLIKDDLALASPRILDKIIEPLVLKDPNKFLSDAETTMSIFYGAQKFRKTEEFLDVEMIHQAIFGHDNTYGIRPVVAFTCEDKESIRARLVAATGFLVLTKKLHKKEFNAGQIFCLDSSTLNISERFNICEFISQQIDNNEKSLV